MIIGEATRATKRSRGDIPRYKCKHYDIDQMRMGIADKIGVSLYDMPKMREVKTVTEEQYNSKELWVRAQCARPNVLCKDCALYRKNTCSRPGYPGRVYS
jgi:hypothetical protein